ncbi:MAG: DUF4058 family protein [Planctomycetes bacterium]|nr:DUF4058 family protein [Planctomycetota bacterium]
MPSPFPGMDPYLEDPGGWLDFHNRLITYLSDDLNGSIGEGYVARMTERVVVEAVREAPRGIYPDVALVTRRPGGGVAGAAAADPWVRVKAAAGAEFREAGVEILDRTGNRVVTVIEVLSPSNKAAGGAGRRKYRSKQREVLASPTHLVEIDLLRAGSWTVAVPQDVARLQDPFDYLVSISRANGREEDEFDLYPIRAEDRLPRIAIPLGPGDPDAVADLQGLVARCYDRGQYARLIDYRREPATPLPAPKVPWAEEVLRRAGLRG